MPDVNLLLQSLQPMPSGHRSLRPDPTFDALVKHVYPNKEVYDEFEVDVLQKMHLFSNSRALSDSVQEGMRRQALVRSTRGRRRSRAPLRSEESSRPSKKVREDELAESAQADPLVLEGVPVELKRASTEPGLLGLPELRARHLRVPNTCCVAHLVQYVFAPTALFGLESLLCPALQETNFLGHDLLSSLA